KEMEDRIAERLKGKTGDRKLPVLIRKNSSLSIHECVEAGEDAEKTSPAKRPGSSNKSRRRRTSSPKGLNLAIPSMDFDASTLASKDSHSPQSALSPLSPVSLLSPSSPLPDSPIPSPMTPNGNSQS